MTATRRIALADDACRHAGSAVLLIRLVVAAGVLVGGGYLVSALVAAADRRPDRRGRAARRRSAIARDADGVPTITAQDDEELAFGLGFVHAQDRLFQMELQRRYGAGRLAEIFGAAGGGDRPADARARPLSRRRGRNPELSPAVNARARAYAAGVNAFLATRGRRAAARISAAALRARKPGGRPTRWSGAS